MIDEESFQVETKIKKIQFKYKKNTVLGTYFKQSDFQIIHILLVLCIWIPNWYNTNTYLLSIYIIEFQSSNFPKIGLNAS